jgi:peptidyl-prolyl cis-trans isomerase D
MLSIFRRGVWSKLMLVVLGLGLFAIVITGFGTGGMGGIGGLAGGGTTLASVEGETVDTTDATDQVDRQLARMRQQQPGLDTASFVRGGALEEIVDQLVTDTSLLVFARGQGLAASKQMVDREILAIPAFQNLAGTFDEDAFRRSLASEKISERTLREEIAASLIQRQLMLPVASSSHVPQGLAFQYASLLLESRSGTVGLVPAQAMGQGSEPSDAEVAAFFRSNQARYTIPERRVVRYAAFGPEQVAAKAQATDAEIDALYRQNAAAYAARETRTLSQVVLPDETAARALAARIAGGTGFAQAASAAGFSAADTALGEQSREAFARTSSPAVAAAAFAAARGATAGPVKSQLGWHVVRVDDVKVIAGRPLTAVRGELAAQIGQRKAQEALADLTTKIEEALDEGSSLEEIARAEKLAIVETPPITAAGAAPEDAGWRASPELAPLLEAAFDMTEDDEPVVETIAANQRFALLAVSRVVAAAPPPLARIKDRVKADLIARRASDRARAVAAALVARINAGTPPALAFAQADVRLPAPEPVTAARRDIARQNSQVPPPLAMLFSLPRGKARLLAAPEGAGWFVVHLDKLVPGDARREPQLIDAIRTQFSQILGDEYARQFTTAVQADMDIERDSKAVAALKARLTGGRASQ